jgi:chromosome segregation ATPase
MTEVDKHVGALTDLQYRFEEQVEEIRKLRMERDAAVASTADMERQHNLRVAELDQMKETRARLESELSMYRDALRDGPTNDQTAFLKAKEEALEALAEKATLEKRIASMTGDFEFTRTQYQAASTAAAEASAEVSSLKEQVASLQVQASGEAVKLRALTAASGEQIHLDRIRELELILADREAHLHRKEEELRLQPKGRGVTTRAGSVPKSPSLRAAKPQSRATSPNVAVGSTSANTVDSKLLGPPLRYGLDRLR